MGFWKELKEPKYLIPIVISLVLFFVGIILIATTPNRDDKNQPKPGLSSGQAAGVIFLVLSIIAIAIISVVLYFQFKKPLQRYMMNQSNLSSILGM